MWSGGLDSTAALVWMLENTNDDIHAHHIYLQNRENRAQAEQVASENMLAYLEKNYRPFLYTESKWEMEGFVPYDIFVYAAQASFLCCGRRGRKSYKRLVTGSIKSFRHRVSLDRRREVANNIFKAGTSHLKEYKNVEWFKPLVNMTKEEVYQSLPKDLRSLTWSCRFPRYVEEHAQVCGKCPSCMAMKRVRGELTQEEIRKYKKWLE
jgi:7-cyano-7-deazaguanine synthase in queuosine biosynthesis